MQCRMACLPFTRRSPVPECRCRPRTRSTRLAPHLNRGSSGLSSTNHRRTGTRSRGVNGIPVGSCGSVPAPSPTASVRDRQPPPPLPASTSLQVAGERSDPPAWLAMRSIPLRVSQIWRARNRTRSAHGRIHRFDPRRWIQCSRPQSGASRSGGPTLSSLRASARRPPRPRRGNQRASSLFEPVETVSSSASQALRRGGEPA